jgi:hypothetical protein
MTLFVANGALLLVGGRVATLVVEEEVPETAPSVFGGGDWTIADAGTGGDATVTITALPDPGSSALTSIQYRIDAGAWTQLTASPAVGTFPINNQFTDGVAVDVTIRAVNSTESGPSAVPISVTTSAPLAAPAFSVAAADSLSTRTLTVTTGTVTGNPTPSLSIAMTLDDGTNTGNVLPTGTGPWTYEVPSSLGSQTVAWTVTATNSQGTATSTGSEVVAADVNPAIEITSATYTDGGAGSGPSLAISGLILTGAAGPYEVYGATHANGTTLTAANIENGTGDAEDIFDFTDADGVVANQIETLTTSLTDGHLSIFIRDANAVESNVFKIDGVDVDATALTVSSSVPADNATGVATNSTIAITFSENAFGVAGKDFYLYDDINTTPVLVETFTFDDDDSATGDNGGSASIVDDVLTLTPGAMAGSTQHSVRWEAGAVTDPWGNDIAANTGDTALNFTTAAAPTLTMPDYGTRLSPTNSGGVYTAAGATLGVGDIYVGVTWLSAGNARTLSGLTVNGVAATQVSGATNGQVTGAFIYKVTSAVASGDIVATLDAAAANGVAFFVWGPGANTAVLDTSSYENSAPGITTANLNLNTETDGKILAVATFFGTDAGTLATGHTGIAEISGAQADVDNNDRVTALEADVTTGETPRTVTANISASTNWMKIATVSLGAA